MLSASPILLDINPDGPSNPSDFVQVGDIAFFVANDGTHGRELWMTNGTAPGTSMVADIRPGEASSNPASLVNVGGILYFSANDGENGRELWRSDGTEEGTYMVRDIFQGTYTNSAYQTTPNSSHPAWLTDVDGVLFFTARDGVNGIELWKSDGTAEGTVLVRNIHEGTAAGTSAPASSDPSQLTSVDGILFFTANDGQRGRELWKSDGTEAGTVLVKDIYPGTSPLNPDDATAGEAPNSSFPGLLTPLDGVLYFVADDGLYGPELWRSDGTEAGTMLVKDIRSGAEGAFTNFSLMVAMDGLLLFTADDGVHGDELWRSDGTEAGTVLVKDIRPGSAGDLSLYGGLTVVDGVLYFAANDGDTGKELWKSDGTEEGTVLVAEIRPGTYEDGTPRPSFPFHMAGLDGVLYFSAFADDTGRELWRSDGTAEGTMLVADLAPGSASSNPALLTPVGNRLFFTAAQDAGPELWMLDTNETVGLSIYVDGELVEIPANIGIYSDGSNAAAYTIAGDGTIYLDAPGEITLADFFATWRTDAGVAGDNPDAILTSNQVLAHVAGASHWLQVFVDGSVVADFESYVLQGGEQIAVVYGVNPVVSLVTNFGSILIELFENETPGTVDNFLNYVNSGAYLNSFFHRSVENFVIQGGGFTTTSTTFTNFTQLAPVPTDPPITNEPGISNLRGTIAMAKLSGDPHSATSQFFINLGDNSQLDLEANGAFTVFGRVLSMTTVDVIADLPIDRSGPPPFGELPLSDEGELAVITDLEGQGKLTGVVFIDANADGVMNEGDVGLSGAIVYVDGNGNGVFDEGEVFTVTDADGNYRLQLDPGEYTIRFASSADVLQTVPAAGAGYSVAVEIGRHVAELNFGQQTLAAPGGVELLPTSDTGVSDSDHVTSLNNASPDKALQFLVTGVTPTAEVQIFASGVLVGSAVAATSEVIVTTDGATALADGDYEITVIQILGSVVSGPADPLELHIDATPPADFITTPPATAAIGQLFEYDVDSPDEGLAGLEYSLIGAPDGMTIDPLTGEITWTPTADQAVPQQFEVRLTDLAGNTTSQSIELTVLGDLPIYPDHYTVDEDEVLTVDAVAGVLANDGDEFATELTAVLVEGPVHGSLTFNADGSFTYTPDPDFFGTDSFTYTASDGERTGNVAKVTITVNPVYDPPVGVEDQYELNEDTVLVVDAAAGVLANDINVDGAVLTAELVTGPSLGSLEFNPDGSFTYTPFPDAHGVDTFTYRVSDGITITEPVLVTLTVHPVNDPPVAVPISYEVDEDGVLEVDAAGGVLSNDFDVDGDQLTAVLVIPPTHGTLTLAIDGSFTYAPNPDFFGTDTFTYVASDGMALSEPAVVTITVLGQPDPPTANDDNFTVPNDGAVHTLDVLANDTSEPDEEQELTIITVTQGSQGGSVAIDADGKMILYTAPSGFAGTETFTYTIIDTDGLTDSATVNILVVDSGSSVISGFVYLDSNGNGLRDGGEMGVPGVLVTLTGTTSADQSMVMTAITADDGSYLFESLPAGTYQIIQSQPAALRYSAANTTIPNAVVAENAISNIVIGGASQHGNNNFGQRSLKPEHASIAWFFASTQANDGFFREVIAQGEEMVGNAELAAAIRAHEPAFDAAAAQPQSLAASAGALAGASSALSASSALAVAVDADAAAQVSSVLVEAPTAGAVAIGAQGAFSYEPGPTGIDSDEFRYEVTSGTSASVSATVTIAVSHSTGSSSLAAATSPSATSPAVLLSDPLHGVASINGDGSFAYHPAYDPPRTDSFRFQLSSGTSTAEVAVAVQVTALEAEKTTHDGNETAIDAVLSATLEDSGDEQLAAPTDLALDAALSDVENWLLA